MTTDNYSGAISSTDLVRAYRDNPRVSKAVAQRLADLTNAREPYNFSDLQRIVAEENALAGCNPSAPRYRAREA